MEDEVDFLAKNIGDCKLCRLSIQCTEILSVVKLVPVGVVFRCPIVMNFPDEIPVLPVLPVEKEKKGEEK